MAGSSFSLSTSVSLIRRVRAVEPGSWEMLLRLYGPLIYRFARRRGLQGQDAADVMQNVFLLVWRGIQHFSFDRPDASFRGWLNTITRNSIREQLRRLRGQPSVVAALKDVTDARQETLTEDVEADGTVDDLFSELSHRALQVVRDSVDESTWNAFWSTTIDDQPVSDVAKTMGMSPAAVRQAKYRVLCRLRSLMADQ